MKTNARAQLRLCTLVVLAVIGFAAGCQGGRDNAGSEIVASSAPPETPPQQDRVDISGAPILAQPVIGSQVWRGGTVITLDAGHRIAQALLIENDRIAAVGSNADAESWLTPATRVVELNGRTVMPGFVEGHGHFPGAGLGAVGADLNSPPIGDVTRIEHALELLRAVLARRESVGDVFNLEGNLGLGSAWLLGFGYDDTQIDDNRHLTRHDLDLVSTTEPIYVMHISGHIGYVNSVGLERLGITRDTPDPEGGHIGRDESGEPDGSLFETARDEPQAQALNFSPREQVALVDAGVKIYAARGFTTVQMGGVAETLARTLAVASNAYLIPQRLIMWPDPAFGAALANGSSNPSIYSGSRVRLGATKFWADGSIQGYTGYLRAPYHDPGSHESFHRGMPTMSVEDMTVAVIEQQCAGRQVAIHGNGDAGIDNAITAITAAQEACPQADTRHILVHAQMAQTDQLRRFAQLGITPSFFAAHVYYWGDRHRDIFMGPARAARMSPMAEARALGLRYSTHLDAPIVPVDATMQLWSAVARQTAAGEVLGLEFAASRLDSLKALTIEAAWQNFMEDEVGSIEVGKFADLVVSEQNPLDESVSLARFAVQETWVGGQRLH